LFCHNTIFLVKNCGQTTYTGHRSTTAIPGKREIRYSRNMLKKLVYDCLQNLDLNALDLLIAH